MSCNFLKNYMESCSASQIHRILHFSWGEADASPSLQAIMSPADQHSGLKLWSDNKSCLAIKVSRFYGGMAV